MAALLSLPIEAPSAGAPALSQYRNQRVYHSSFLVSQRDMFASVVRASGTAEADWTVRHEAAAARFAAAQQPLPATGRPDYVKAMYSRVLYPDGAGCFDDRLANAALGLPAESLDSATRDALDRVEKGIAYRPAT